MKKIKKFHYLRYQKVQIFAKNGSAFYLKLMVTIYYQHHECANYISINVIYLGHIRVGAVPVLKPL